MSAWGTSCRNECGSVEARLAKWHKEYGIQIPHAETDFVEIRFITMPRNMKAFAKEVYMFCPDIVNQELETEEKLAAQIKKNRGLYLWWD